MRILLAAMDGFTGSTCRIKDLFRVLKDSHRITKEAAQSLIDEAVVDGVLTVSHDGEWISRATEELPMAVFYSPWHPGPLSYDAEGQPARGATVDDFKLAKALQGVCSGPLALRFADQPELLGHFAARMVTGSNGAREVRLYPHFPAATMKVREGEQNLDFAGASVFDVLIAHAILGLTMGPLVTQYDDNPEGLGEFAQNVVMGAHAEWYEEL